MIVITHDLAVLDQIADTILVMYAGKLAEKAPAEEIVSTRGTRTRACCSRRCPKSVSATPRSELTGIPGRPPPLLEPPTGCRFRDRCPLATERCEQEPPGWRSRRRRLLGGTPAHEAAVPLVGKAL